MCNAEFTFTSGFEDQFWPNPLVVQKVSCHTACPDESYHRKTQVDLIADLKYVSIWAETDMFLLVFLEVSVC